MNAIVAYHSGRAKGLIERENPCTVCRAVFYRVCVCFAAGDLLSLEVKTRRGLIVSPGRCRPRPSVRPFGEEFHVGGVDEPAERTRGTNEVR